MNKRQLKKRNKKCLPVIADESNLLTMTSEERDQAIKDMLAYRKKYGYRKRYKELKGKYLTYYYPIGKTSAELYKKLYKLARGRKASSISIVNQNLDEIKKLYGS